MKVKYFIGAALIVFASCVTAALWVLAVADLPPWVAKVQGVLTSTLMGGLGGALYCLRAVYLNAAVHDRFSPRWYIWYFLRPAASLILGGISFVVLKAGLLLLNGAPADSSSSYGFMALALIAGLNVDRFVQRLEDAAKAAFGIEKSRTSTRDDEPPRD
jgi:hypothetical protein